MKRSKRAALVAFALAGLLVFGLPTSPATARRASGYRITIQNLISGQPLTPPVVALHRKQVDVFTPGDAASFEVKEIAENGNTQPLVDLLSAQAGVADVFAGEAPIVPRDRQDETGFEDTLTFTLEGGRQGSLLVLGVDADLHERRLHGSRRRCPADPSRRDGDVLYDRVRQWDGDEHRGLCRYGAAVSGPDRGVVGRARHRHQQPRDRDR